MDETTLLRAWRRRIATRGALVVLLTTIPVVMAGLISVGGGGGLLPEGIASLSSGPSPEAAGIDVPAADSGTADTAGGLVALAVPRGASGPGSGAAGGGETGTPTAPAPGGAPSGGGGTQPGGPGGEGGGGGGGGTNPAVPPTKVPGSGSGSLAQTLDPFGQAVNELLKPK
jgi:hypothetical protein